MQIEKWLSPKTLPELQEILSSKKESDYFINGGTDLMVALKAGKYVAGVIDLTHLKELCEIKQNPHSLFIGGGLTYDDIAKNDIVCFHFPALAKAASMVGSQQIRNRGTMAGSVANASPAGDIFPVLCCLQAAVKLIDSNGSITAIPISDFVVNAGKTILQNNQCIFGFDIPVGLWQKTAYIKLGSRSQVTIAQMTATIALSLCKDEIIKCNLTVGSIGTKPVCLQPTEQLFLGKNSHELTEKTFLEAAEMYAEYIRVNVPKEFDRDYKAVAVIGVFEDLFSELVLQN